MHKLQEWEDCCKYFLQLFPYWPQFSPIKPNSLRYVAISNPVYTVMSHLEKDKILEVVQMNNTDQITLGICYLVVFSTSSMPVHLPHYSYVIGAVQNTSDKDDRLYPIILEIINIYTDIGRKFKLTVEYLVSSIESFDVKTQISVLQFVVALARDIESETLFLRLLSLLPMNSTAGEPTLIKTFCDLLLESDCIHIVLGTSASGIKAMDKNILVSVLFHRLLAWSVLDGVCSQTILSEGIASNGLGETGRQIRKLSMRMVVDMWNFRNSESPDFYVFRPIIVCLLGRELLVILNSLRKVAGLSGLMRHLNSAVPSLWYSVVFARDVAEKQVSGLSSPYERCVFQSLIKTLISTKRSDLEKETTPIATSSTTACRGMSIRAFLLGFPCHSSVNVFIFDSTIVAMGNFLLQQVSKVALSSVLKNILQKQPCYSMQPMIKYLSRIPVEKPEDIWDLFGPNTSATGFNAVMLIENFLSEMLADDAKPTLRSRIFHYIVSSFIGWGIASDKDLFGYDLAKKIAVSTFANSSNYSESLFLGDFIAHIVHNQNLSLLIVFICFVNDWVDRFQENLKIDIQKNIALSFFRHSVGQLIEKNEIPVNHPHDPSPAQFYQTLCASLVGHLLILFGVEPQTVIVENNEENTCEGSWPTTIQDISKMQYPPEGLKRLTELNFAEIPPLASVSHIASTFRAVIGIAFNYLFHLPNFLR